MSEAKIGSVIEAIYIQIGVQNRYFFGARDREIELERDRAGERERERNLPSKPQAVLRYGALSTCNRGDDTKVHA